MLQGCSPSHDWLCESEPLLFDDEFCQSLMKDLQSIPTPPQSPPVKAGLGKPMSSVDQLELVSELLMEDNDFLHLDWSCDFTSSADDPLPDCLWHTGADKHMEEKLSAVLSTSPLLSDIDSEIFAEIAGSTLDCHNVALACQALESDDLPLEVQERIESTSDYGSLSTGGESSTSDSEEEIDVVTVMRSSTLTRSRHQQQLEESRREQQRVLKRHTFEIQQQHNYAAPRPASPPPAPPSVCSAPPLKRSRVIGESHRSAQSSGRSRTLPSRQGLDTEDEEERRRTHNVMERQRRNELKNCFLKLRDNVPELSNNDKASKVVILKRAKESIRNLESEHQRLGQKKDKLLARQEQLRARLEKLKKL